MESIAHFFSHEPEWYWDNCRLELGFVFLFALGTTKFILGKNESEKKAMNWRKVVVPLLKNEFEHLGCESDKQSLALMQRSYSDYEYFASGRKNVYYTEFQISLSRRHCLFSSLSFDLLNNVQDSLYVNIPIDLKGRNLPLEFFICRKKDLKSKLATLEYIGRFVRNSQPKHLKLSEEETKSKTSLIVMAEHDEVSNQLIDEEMGMVLKKFQKYVMSIHVTDQKVYNNFPLFLKAELALPENEDDKEGNEAAYTLIGMLLRLTDNISSLRYSTNTAKICEKARKTVQKEEAKAAREQLEEKKLEAKREQERLERERIKKMTPEQQAKYEEKQRKKEQQRMKSKMMKVVKH
jgi:hypothetical protein